MKFYPGKMGGSSLVTLELFLLLVQVKFGMASFKNDCFHGSKGTCGGSEESLFCCVSGI